MLLSQLNIVNGMVRTIDANIHKEASMKFLTSEHKGYSHKGLFQCPICNKETWQNLNYLGQGWKLICNGEKIKKEYGFTD